jgi:hypothetical protein
MAPSKLCSLQEEKLWTAASMLREKKAIQLAALSSDHLFLTILVV